MVLLNLSSDAHSVQPSLELSHSRCAQFTSGRCPNRAFDIAGGKPVRSEFGLKAFVTDRLLDTWDKAVAACPKLAEDIMQGIHSTLARGLLTGRQCKCKGRSSLWVKTLFSAVALSQTKDLQVKCIVMLSMIPLLREHFGEVQVT